jgi:hypothetical protein
MASISTTARLPSLGAPVHAWPMELPGPLSEIGGRTL